MITGVVNALLDATIRVRVSGPSGQELELEAVVDTGFSGFLTLPAGSIASLGLPWLCRIPGLLADGNVDLFDVHAATVDWDGQPRTVEVEAANCEPLLGMSLMHRHRLQVDVVSQGLVKVEPLP
jgi:clan AA aspartic protease